MSDEFNEEDTKDMTVLDENGDELDTDDAVEPGLEEESEAEPEEDDLTIHTKEWYERQSEYNSDDDI